RHTGINRPVKRDADFYRTGRPDSNRLRCLGVTVTDFEKFALALWAGAPIGISAVTGDIKVALWGNRYIGCEHVQAGNQSLFAQVTHRSLHEPNPPDFASRLARHECVAFPPGRAERLAPFARFVEDQTTA